MVVSESKGSVRLDKEAVRAWERRVKEVEKKEQERRRRRASRRASGADPAPA
jgi:hypothetical protein